MTAAPLAKTPRTRFALTPERERQIAAAFPAYAARMARIGLEPLSFEGFRYASLEPEERIAFDHGSDVLASLLSGPAKKGTFELAYSTATERR